MKNEWEQEDQDLSYPNLLYFLVFGHLNPFYWTISSAQLSVSKCSSFLKVPTIFVFPHHCWYSTKNRFRTMTSKTGISSISEIPKPRLPCSQKKPQTNQQVNAFRLWLINITSSHRLMPSDSQIYLFFISKTLISKQHKQTFCRTKKPPNTKTTAHSFNYKCTKLNKFFWFGLCFLLC